MSLREKDLPAAERLALLRRLVAAGAAYGACLTIHDDVAAAAEAGAAGVHLSAGSSVQAARQALGGTALIGKSAHNADEIRAAAAAGADYVTLSPIFATISKPGYGPALGLALLQQTWPLPVVALGGIDPTKAAECFTAGAAGIAVMGEAMRAPDPRVFMAELLERTESKLAAKRVGTHNLSIARDGRAST